MNICNVQGLLPLSSVQAVTIYIYIFSYCSSTTATSRLNFCSLASSVWLVS